MSSEKFDKRLLRALGRVKIKAFRFKFDPPDGPIRFGPLAQDIIAELEAEGLNADDYAFIQRDPETDRLSVDLAQFNLLRSLSS